MEMRENMNIRDYLKSNKIVADGAFGTYYSEEYHTKELPEKANTVYPERVVAIHKAYIEAGARLIRTNTFASNTGMLNQDINVIKENIKAAISLAKEVVKESGKNIYIAGDIGPIGNLENREVEELEEEYYQIANTFMEEGIDILTFETFSDMENILSVIKRIKQTHNPFIMVQFCVNQFGYSNSGLSAKKLIREACGVEEIDAVGLNCGIGPAHMKQIFSQIDSVTDKYLTALPNAGYPMRISNRMQFSNNPDYFAEIVKDSAKKGMDIIGGCCGTTPEFIKKLSKVIDYAQNKTLITDSDEKETETECVKKGFFHNADGSVKQKKLIAVELAPPVNADDEKLLEAAHFLKNLNVDVLTFPDSPSGRTRVDSVLMAEKVRIETGLDVMPHICCRDKNAIAIRSLLLGAHINDINNMLVITGDPVPSMTRQAVKAVFNFDSIGLMKIIKEMNEDNFPEKPICYGGAINQGRRNLDIEINRIIKKMEAGAEFFLTQPVFTREDADRVRYIKEKTGARILCGIMPLISRRNALFMKNEIAGIAVTDEIVNRYSENAGKEEGEAVGIQIAKEVIEYTNDFADGYYFSFPFNRVHMLKDII